MSVGRASGELPVLIINGADSPRSRIGRGLESIGGMTAETLQRLSTAVGGVVKSPVVLMAKVGGLASPRAAPTLAAPPGSSLEERVYHLEIQMKSLEEKFNSMTVVTELDLSTRSHKEKPRIAKSLLQEMETGGILEKRVQMLEDHLNERMERFEKALSSIQSRLDHVEYSRRERMAGYECQESLSGEPQYYDAEQQSDNFEALEAIEQKKFRTHDVPGVTTRCNPTLEKSRVKETSIVAPTTAEHVEPLQEIDTGENDDFLDPKVVSTPVYSKEAFLTQPLKPVAPISEPAESSHRDDVGNVSASSDRQLASTLEELHGSFVTESSATATSAKFLEIARAVTAEKSTFVPTSSEPQSASILKEPHEAFPEEPSIVVLAAKSKEHPQEDVIDKSGTTITVVESPLPSTFEATQKDFTKELLTAIPNAKLAQELTTQGVVIIALASSEPLVTSKSMKEPLVVVPSANSKEPAQAEIGDKNVTMIARESSEALAFQDPQEDFVKESLTSAPSVGSTHETSSQEDSSTTSGMALASFESLVASKSEEEPLTSTSGANFEEHAQDDVVGKSGSAIATTELPLASSLEKPHEEFVEEFTVVAPSAKSAQVLTTQEDNDMQVEALESQMVSKFVEDPSSAAPSVNFVEPTQEEDVDKTGTTMPTTESSLMSSLEESKEDSEKESMASVPSGQPMQEHSDMAVASSKTEGASKFVEEASVAKPPSANFGEHEHKGDADESDSIILNAESPLVSSFNNLHKDFEESSVAAMSAKPAQELATQEDSNMALTASKTTVKSKFVEDPSIAVASDDFEEPAHEDIDKGVTITRAAESPLPTSHEDLQEDFEKESLGVAQSARPIHESSSQEGSGAISDKALVSSEPQVASKFEEKPLSNVPNANFEEHACEDDVDKSVTITTAAELPLPISHEGPQEDFEKESLATAPSVGLIHEPLSQEDLGATSDKAPTSSEPKVSSKFVEEPLAIVSSVSFEEPTHKDATNKSVTMTANGEDPQKDFVKEALISPSDVGLIHKLSSQEDLDATSDMAFASFAPHLASKFVEKPTPTTPSANSEEPTHDKDVVKSDTMNVGADSPLASSFEEPQEDFEEESLAATSSHESPQKLAAEEDSHMVPTSFESQEASKSMEEPSSTVPSADFEEPTHEDAVDKSVAMTAARVSPSTYSFKGPQEDSENESIAVAPSTEPTQELATQEDSNMALPEPQVDSKFVEEPSATDEPSAKFEEPTCKDTVDKSGSVTATTESPSVSTLEVFKEDYAKDSLAAGASAKVLESTKEYESGKSAIAFTPLEAPSASFFGLPQEAFLKEPSDTSAQFEEPSQEKSGIMLPGAKSTLTSTIEEGNPATKEVEYKLAEDFKIHHEHIKSIEKEFPKSQSNLAHAGSDESLVAEDSDDRLESDQSGEEFFDAEHGSGNFEPWESDEPKSFEEFSASHDEPTGINVVAQKATLVPTSSMEHAQEPEQAPAQEPEQALARELTQEPDQTHVRELEQEPNQTPARELEQDYESVEQAQEQEQGQHTYGQQLVQEHGQQPAQEHGQETRQEYKPSTTEAPGQETVQERGHKLEQQFKQPMQEPEQEDLTRNSAMVLSPLEPQVTSEFGESSELLIEEHLATVPSTESEETPQVNANEESSTRDLPLTSTSEEPQIDTAVSLEKNLSSASFHQNSNLDLMENLEHKSLDTPGTNSTPQEALEKEPLIDAPTTKIAHEHDIGKSGAIFASSESQLTPTLEEPHEVFVKESPTEAKSASKSVDLDESLTDEPLTVTSTKLAQESIIDKISIALDEESPLTSIAEEPQNSSVSSLVEGKHGQDEADQKFLEDVKIIAEPIEEAIPRTQSDLTHVKLNPKAIEDDTKLQSQGSFLTLGATEEDSKEALVKEPLPSTKLLKLFEEENDSGEKDPILVDSLMTSIVAEPQKPLAKESLASAKSVPKGHARWRGFARSSSEPQFAYKLEEHRKALAKESSMVDVPSASKLGEEHAQEDFGDTQCLPFRILGEGKHPQKESEFKLVDDVKSPTTKSEIASSPYVLEPKPSKIKEKKKKEKKEKKERKPDATKEEKERRLSMGLEEMERKSSLRAEEKDSKYSPRAEEKHKQPFRHLRDRLRHAFSVNKEL